jgi:hypothetical protein
VQTLIEPSAAPAKEGRAKDRAEARLLAEAAVADYFADWCRVGNIMVIADGRLRRLFWRVTDGLDYLRTLVTSRILDVLAGPLPETPADQQRECERMESRR